MTRSGVGAMLVLWLSAGCRGEVGEIEAPVPMPDPTHIEYPVELWDRRIEGETELMIHVNQFGDVDSVLVSATSGYAQFDSAAVRGARRLRFTPGKQGERRVAMWTLIPIRFEQDAEPALGAARASGVNHD